MLLVVLPWGIAIARATEGAFFQQWWQGDVLPKLVGGHESHGAPPGSHLLMLAATFWPGSLALVPAFVFVRRRRRAVERFCLAWLLPAWLVFELVPTKLPHYVLPLLPPLALVCARAVLTRTVWRSRWMPATTLVWVLIGTAAAVGLCVGPLILTDGVERGATLGAAGVGACVLVVAGATFARRMNVAVPVAIAASVILSVSALGALFPNLGALWLSRSAAIAIAAHRHVGTDAPLAAAGYHEPSLVFLVGGDVQLVDAEGLATFMREHPDGLGLIAADARPRFDDAASALGVAAKVLWSGDGFHYSKGRRARLQLLARQRSAGVEEGGDAAPADHQALVAR